MDSSLMDAMRPQGPISPVSQPPGMEGLKSPLPLANGRISQRMPTGSTRTEDPLKDNLLINMHVMRQDPKKTAQAASVVDAYPNTTNAMKEMQPHEKLGALQDQMKRNLLHLWDLMPQNSRERAGKWYLGAHRIADEQADKYHLPSSSVAGLYASQSPSFDWFKNVHLGDRMLDLLDKDPKLSHEMVDQAHNFGGYKPEYIGALRGLVGKRLSDMDVPEQALAMRLWDELYGPKQYRKINPEGERGDFMRNLDGSFSKPAWQSLDNLRKGLKSIRSGGDMDKISPLMGDKHKVRNFYNSIIDPIGGQRFGDYTADTHAISGSLFRPLGGSSREVSQGLHSSPKPGGEKFPMGPQSAVTGLQGLYPLHADAGRAAAAERGVPAREMQSVTWEALRSLFANKSAKMQKMVDALWHEHSQGRMSEDETRRKIVDAVGGFQPPTW